MTVRTQPWHGSKRAVQGRSSVCKEDKNSGKSNRLVVRPSNGWLQKWLYQVDSTEWRHKDSWSWKGEDTRTFLDLSSVLGTSSEGTSKTLPLELTLSETGEGQGPLARASLYLFFKELTYCPDALFIYGSSRIQKTLSEVKVGSDHTGATHCQWLLGLLGSGPCTGAELKVLLRVLCDTKNKLQGLIWLCFWLCIWSFANSNRKRSPWPERHVEYLQWEAYY